MPPTRTSSVTATRSILGRERTQAFAVRKCSNRVKSKFPEQQVDLKMMSSAFAIGFVSEFSLFLRARGTRNFRGAGRPGGGSHLSLLQGKQNKVDIILSEATWVYILNSVSCGDRECQTAYLWQSIFFHSLQIPLIWCVMLQFFSNTLSSYFHTSDFSLCFHLIFIIFLFFTVFPSWLQKGAN